MISNVFHNLFSVGISGIDEQHIEILTITNLLNDAIINKEGIEKVSELIIRLIDYADMHFKYEEAFMDLYPDYPMKIFHKEAHCNTLQKVSNIKNMIETNEPINETEVLWFLREWLADHILRIDRDFGKFLQSKGVK